MTESEAQVQIKSIPDKIWMQISKDDKEAIKMAYMALEKLEKIKRVLDTTCLSDDVTKCYYDGDCRLHEYKEIVKIVRSDEE